MGNDLPIRFYAEGWDAYEAGQTVDSCPYKEPLDAAGYTNRERWLCGWRAAESESVKSTGPQNCQEEIDQ